MIEDLLRQFAEELSDPQELVVAIQAVLVAAVLLIASLLQPLWRRLARAVDPHLPQVLLQPMVKLVGRRILFPLTALIIGQLSLELIKNLDRAAGLLSLLNTFLAVWLLYRAAAAIIESSMNSAKARFWTRWVLLPAAFVITILSTLGLLQQILNWGIFIESLGWSLTIGSVLLAAIIILAFVGIARWVRRRMAQSFLPKAGLDPPLANTVSKLITYGIVSIGILFALSAMGVNLTTLTVIAGGLSVGLAFGLQEIVNNFVSGFILLFERSIQVGDVVNVDNNVGVVQQIGVRSTTIRTRDNVELIIPNSYFLTQVVTNLTRTENLVRTRISVGVSYGAAPREVEQALLTAAHRHTLVLADPEPTVQFMDFGDSSLNFDLLIWTNQAMDSLILSSDLRYNIWDALDERNIEIPFPQRDIHIRSADPLLNSNPAA